MSRATTKNEIQVVLQEYLENRWAERVAKRVYTVIQAETQYTYNGKRFFINEDSHGALVLTMESMVKEHVETILAQYLEKYEVRKCLKRLMEEGILTEMTTEVETISIEGWDSQIYFDLLKYTTANKQEKEFLESLKEAINARVKAFKVPVCDPSIVEDFSLQFVAGCKPAVGYNYGELKQMAFINALRLGTKNQYVLFLATIINRLVEEGWSMVGAFYAVCVDSSELGHYWDSKNSKYGLELTGSRKIAGKCDLANTNKILANDGEAGGLWIAGGNYMDSGCEGRLAKLIFFPCKYYSTDCSIGVGWFVF